MHTFNQRSNLMTFPLSLQTESLCIHHESNIKHQSSSKSSKGYDIECELDDDSSNGYDIEFDELELDELELDELELDELELDELDELELDERSDSDSNRIFHRSSTGIDLR